MSFDGSNPVNPGASGGAPSGGTPAPTSCAPVHACLGLGLAADGTIDCGLTGVLVQPGLYPIGVYQDVLGNCQVGPISICPSVLDCLNIPQTAAPGVPDCVPNPTALPEAVAYIGITAGALPTDPCKVELVAPPVSSGGLRRSYGTGTIRCSTGSGSNSQLPLFVSSGGHTDLLSVTPDGNFNQWPAGEWPYERCFWLFRLLDHDVYNAPILAEDMQFATVADLFAFADSLAMTVGEESISLECYDILDNEPVVPKMYGYNDAYSIVKGANQRYWGSDERVSNPIDTAAQNMLMQMWSLAFGYALPVFNPNLFWLHSKQISKRYRLPRPEALELSRTGNRQYWDASVPGVVAGGGQAVHDPNAQEMAVYGDLAQVPGTGFGTFDYYGAHKGISSAVMSGQSVVVGIPVADRGVLPSGNAPQALYVKPVGIDVVAFEPFDTTTHRLELVGHSNEHARLRIRVVDPATHFHQFQGGDLIGTAQRHWRIRVSDFVDVFKRASFNHGNTHASGGFRAQLRNLATNKVSRLSNAKVTTERARLRPWSLMIRTTGEGT